MVLSDLTLNQIFKTTGYNKDGSKKVFECKIIRFYEEDGEKFYIVESEGKVFTLNPLTLINEVIRWKI